MPPEKEQKPPYWVFVGKGLRRAGEEWVEAARQAGRSSWAIVIAFVGAFAQTLGTVLRILGLAAGLMAILTVALFSVLLYPLHVFGWYSRIPAAPPRKAPS